MSLRILSTETVTAMIPLVQRIADDLERAYQRASTLLQSSPAADTNPEVAGLLDRVQACVSEFEALGGTLRSYEPVRVDFISEVDGEIGYVCWESGDREAMHFHGAMERCEGNVLTA